MVCIELLAGVASWSSHSSGVQWYSAGGVHWGRVYIQQNQNLTALMFVIIALAQQMKKLLACFRTFALLAKHKH